MLAASPKSSGFTLIEMMVAIAIIAIGVTLGLPSYRTWVQNTQIRNAAESIQNGLQRARAEAVGRNTNVEFVLLGADPDWVTSWEVRVVSAPVPPIDSRSGREGSKNVTGKGWAADGATAATTITFTNLARVVNPTNADGSATLRSIDLDSAVLDPADSRELRVTVGLGGNIRMCDPNPALDASDPRKC